MYDLTHIHFKDEEADVGLLRLHSSLLTESGQHCTFARILRSHLSIKVNWNLFQCGMSLGYGRGSLEIRWESLIH